MYKVSAQYIDDYTLPHSPTSFHIVKAGSQHSAIPSIPIPRDDSGKTLIRFSVQKMAKPREPAKPDPPPAESEEEESGEEEEGSSEEEGSESGSEPETPQKKAASAPTPSPAPKKPEPAAPKTQTAAASSSSSEDEESGSDTDSTDEDPGPNVKPIASKPMDSPQKASATVKKPRSKPNSSDPTSPTKPGAGSKRSATAEAAAAGEDKGKDAKRSKKVSEAESESLEKKRNSTNDSKKLFQRVWSEDDEIAILEGMLDYTAKKKADPVADVNAFLEFIKKNIHIDVSSAQLKAKIRRLKDKYKNNAEKEKKSKKERTFTNPHEQKAYELSKKVWGNAEEETAESPKANGTAVGKSRSKSSGVGTTVKSEAEEKVKEIKDLVSEKNLDGLKNVSFGPDSLKIEEWVTTKGTDLIKDEKKRAELEEKWRELKVKEIELLSWRSELMVEQTKLILEGLKGPGH